MTWAWTWCVIAFYEAWKGRGGVGVVHVIVWAGLVYLMEAVTSRWVIVRRNARNAA